MLCIKGGIVIYRRIMMIVLCLLFLTGCSHKKTEDYQNVLKGIYEDHGLTGDIEIENIKNVGHLYTTVQTQVDFYYLEKIGKREIKVWDSALFEKNTTKIETDPEELKQSDLMEIGVFSGVVQSFEQQIEFLKLKERVEKQLTTNVLSSKIKLHGIKPYLATFEKVYPEDSPVEFSQSFANYQAEVKKNQKNNAAFKGYFDIDIQENMKSGLISVQIGLDHVTKELSSGDDQITTNQIFSSLLKMDTSKFYDGYYEVSYDNRTKDGSVGGGGKTIHFWVENGEMGKPEIESI
ncbi:hypothetical protein [Vagococcus sp.]|uniref:hypothetical protein n=1 Tax=Vagococcus sp. TaxID=1933889 RepID=UPI002FC859FA